MPPPGHGCVGAAEGTAGPVRRGRTTRDIAPTPQAMDTPARLWGRSAALPNSTDRGWGSRAAAPMPKKPSRTPRPRPCTEWTTTDPLRCLPTRGYGSIPKEDTSAKSTARLCPTNAAMSPCFQPQTRRRGTTIVSLATRASRWSETSTKRANGSCMRAAPCSREDMDSRSSEGDPASYLPSASSISRTFPSMSNRCCGIPSRPPAPAPPIPNGSYMPIAASAARRAKDMTGGSHKFPTGAPTIISAPSIPNGMLLPSMHGRTSFSTAKRPLKRPSGREKRLRPPGKRKKRTLLLALSQTQNYPPRRKRNLPRKARTPVLPATRAVTGKNDIPPRGRTTSRREPQETRKNPTNPPRRTLAAQLRMSPHQ
mmetsp:Transcript_39045/g.90874  ORF Transcript_39045/g.90874 Transcript_39045/m.90874 type:complete len:368 (+) Transcript_39045:930-2033(+)